jgi:hypothetical protein
MPSSVSSVHCNFLLNTSAEWIELPEDGIVDAETRRSGNWCVIWYKLCSAQQLVDQVVLLKIFFKNTMWTEVSDEFVALSTQLPEHTVTLHIPLCNGQDCVLQRIPDILNYFDDSVSQPFSKSTFCDIQP